MVLASQSPRQTKAWRYMTNERRRKRRTWPVFLIGGVAVAVGTWAMLSRQDPTDPGTDVAERDVVGGVDGAESDRESTRPASGWGETPREARAREAAGGTAPGTINIGDARTPRDSSGRHEQAAGDAASKPPAQPQSDQWRPDPEAPPPNAGVAKPPESTAFPEPPNVPAEPRVRPTPEPLREAAALMQRDPVAARKLLTAMAIDPRLSPAERAMARESITEVTRIIIFSKAIIPGDPFSRSRVVREGEGLESIAKKEGLDADWRFLKRVNGIVDERKLKVGQTIKLITGPFHAVVDKTEFRMDVFLGQSEDRVMVASFPVGLGEYNSTPLGRFKVRPRSKLVEPAWTNPRTGEFFRANDPLNPIGDHWIGLQGMDEANKGAESYGIHGTIEPVSIGRQASMGCVRMLAPDVALIYELLTEPNSTVTIVE